MHEKLVGKYATVKTDTTGLDNLLAASKERYVVRIGILGSSEHQRKVQGDLKKRGGHKVGDKPSPLTNADIGLRHEKGVFSEHLPRRSWLVEPLEDHLPEYFRNLGPDVINRILIYQQNKSYQELGIVCLQIVQKGFDTGGYGKWPALSSRTIREKKSSAILIDTGQLRKAITFEVVRA